jgi:hypothetical protein
MSEFKYVKSDVDWKFYAWDFQASPLLYITCNAGLCNRMLAIAGAWRLANVLKRKLVVWWPVNNDDGVGAKFEHLFVNDLKIFSGWDCHWMFDTSHPLKLYNHEQSCQISENDSELILLIRSWIWPRFDGEGGYGTFAAEKAETAKVEMISHLRKLQFQPKIIANVDELGVNTDMFGVHVRRNDHCFRQATNERFFAAIDAELDKCRRKFFLATDNQEVEKVICRRYGNLVVLKTKIYWVRDHLGGMLEAAVDLAALTRTGLIIGTPGSSFSEVASYLGSQCLVNV